MLLSLLSLAKYRERWRHPGVLLSLAHLELLASGAKVAKVQDRSELHCCRAGEQE